MADSTLRVERGTARADDYFFAAMTIWIAVVVFVGFAHSYFLAGLFHAHLPSPLVHIHGGIFSSWILLLIAQVVLAATGHIQWHMRLGLAGLVIAGLMIVVGFATLFAAEHRHFQPDPIFTFDLLSLSVFGILVSWAYGARRDGARHKRLILLATLAITAQGLSRWHYAFLDSDFAFYAVLNLPLLLLAGFDLWSRRTLHSATVWGIAILAAMQLAYIPLARTSAIRGLIAFLQK